MQLSKKINSSVKEKEGSSGGRGEIFKKKEIRKCFSMICVLLIPFLKKI